MSKGKFVVFEGMDGSGKTTIIKRLKEYLESENRLDDFIFTREPGSSHSKEAEEIRQLILDNDNSFSVMVDALLFAASRRLNLEKCVWPGLEKNKTVISDRYWTSSFVYQGVLGGLGLKKVKDINNIATEETTPDLTIFFDMEPELSVERITQIRKTKTDRLESTNVEYYKKLRDSYWYVINQGNEKYEIIKSDCNIDELFKRVLNVLKENKII